MREEILKVTRYLTESYRNQENYKSLRENIAFGEEEIHSLLITSSIPGEGKSTISLNLAAQLANSGLKVLLIDSDMRNSQMMNWLRISKNNRDGLSEILSGNQAIKEGIWKTDVTNLYLIPAGRFPQNPSELLRNGNFSRLLDSCNKLFDMVIIDAPPIGSVIDAAILARHVDGVLFVVGSDLVSRKMAERSVAQLERSGGRILGCVLNKIRMSNRTMYGTYGTNKYYYGKYSDYYGKKEDS